MRLLRAVCVALYLIMAGAVVARALQGCMDAGPGPAIVEAPVDGAL